jgi:hypothetical protein
MGVWSYDFVEAQTHDGRKLRLMTLIDEFTRSPPFGASANLTIPCHTGQAVQIEPSLRPSSPKTGVFQMSAGDYRLFWSENATNRSLETGAKFAKARHWRAFLWVKGTFSLSSGLAG